MSELGRGEPAVGSWELVAAAQQGDRAAFGQLYGRYARSVSGFVGARVRDRELVADLTSETFTRAWRAIGSVRDQGRDVRAWLFTIARNLIADLVKSHRFQRETLAEPGDRDNGAPSVEHMVLARETAAEVRRLVGLLPADQQRVIRLRFLEGLSSRQAAVVMGCSESAVKALQHRGVTRLRSSLLHHPSGADFRPGAPLQAGAVPAPRGASTRVAGQQHPGDSNPGEHPADPTHLGHLPEILRGRQSPQHRPRDTTKGQPAGQHHHHDINPSARPRALRPASRDRR